MKKICEGKSETEKQVKPALLHSRTGLIPSGSHVNPLHVLFKPNNNFFSNQLISKNQVDLIEGRYLLSDASTSVFDIQCASDFKGGGGEGALVAMHNPLISIDHKFAISSSVWYPRAC